MLEEVAQWLSRPAEPGEDGDTLVAALADRLIAAGIPLFRMAVSFRTMHPEVWVRSVAWTRAGMVIREREHGEQSTSDYIDSPVQAIHHGTKWIRERLDGPVESMTFKHLTDLRNGGATDYLIHALPIGAEQPTYVSFTIDRAGGFTEAELDGLATLVGPLALRVALLSAQLATRSLLHIYLGPNAARRVLAGAVRRGNGVELHAAILFSDLRGFTTISDSQPAVDVVRLLDDYFECVAAPVQENGGEVLKFIGDAMLAVFPTDPADPASACEQAIKAAEAGLAALAARMPDVKAGIGVHAGKVLYGNIGAKARLDFTVIGAAVNEASRVQGLCKNLNAPLLVTDAAVAGVRRDDIVSLGTHALRGVREAKALFTLARYRPEANSRD